MSPVFLKYGLTGKNTLWKFFKNLARERMKFLTAIILLTVAVAMADKDEESWNFYKVIHTTIDVASYMSKTKFS
jgi:hypothetical protein